MKENIGFIGAGNMAQALLGGWLARGLMAPETLWISNRTPGKVKKVVEHYKVNGCENNETVIENCDVIVLAVKPQDLETAIEPLSSQFRPEQIVLSLAAGFPLSRLKKMLPQCPHIARIMTNTPAKIMLGTFGYCTKGPNLIVDRLMERLFKPLGFTNRIEEGEAFEAFTVATSSGIGFIYELMIYWQEWIEEHGIDGALAQEMVIQTFAGAAELARQSLPQSLDELQAKVTSKKGVTAAGLESLRELELERLLRYSFEKAALRDRELSED